MGRVRSATGWLVQPSPDANRRVLAVLTLLRR
jgi:hypothetical protein